MIAIEYLPTYFEVIIFTLVDQVLGPKSNPAELPIDGMSSIYVLIKKLYRAMEESKNSSRPVKFLSRYGVLCSVLKDGTSRAAEHALADY